MATTCGSIVATVDLSVSGQTAEGGLGTCTSGKRDEVIKLQATGRPTDRKVIYSPLQTGRRLVYVRVRGREHISFFCSSAVHPEYYIHVFDLRVRTGYAPM